jgi:hypothetical protein
MRRFTALPGSRRSLPLTLLIGFISACEKIAASASLKLDRGQIVVLTYFLGPILALLPKRWRKSLFSGLAIAWRPATVISGFAESVAALIALMQWYSYFMTLLVSNGVDSAMTGKLPTGVTDHEIGFTALVIWATHPLTWLIAYAGVEGTVRLVNAAFSENNLGILPLFLLDKVFAIMTGRGRREAAAAMGGARENAFSYFGAMGEKLLVARLPQVADEICPIRNGTDEIMEIRACRRKEDWIPPRVVRYQNEFYRLEESSRTGAPRPFLYRLRRLPVGVMGRSVLQYSPEAPVLSRKP